MNRSAGLIQDTRYAARMLLRSPGLTLAATVCLGIGIGITASIFSQLRSMVLQDLPGVRLPATLVRLQSATSYPNFEAYRDRSGQFDTLAAYMSPVPFVLTSPDGQRDRVWGQLITPNYFSVLGVQAQSGRMLSPGEQRAGAAPAAIISYRLWQSRFGGRGDLVGRTIRLNGHPVEVAGVASRDFLGASPMLSAADVWVPVIVEATIAPELGRNVLQNYTARNFQLIGRLKSGLTRQQAEAALDATARQLEQFYNDPNRDRQERRVTLLPGGRLLPIQDKDLPSVLGFPLLFVGLILFMTCVNIATLLLARVAARRREISVRVALGAGRGRIVRQWLIESTFLGVLGGLAGVVVAVWRNSSVGPISRILPPYMNFELRLDWQALVVAALAAVLTGVLVGLAPALKASGQDVFQGLKAGAAPRRSRYRWLNLRNILVLQQVTAALVILLLTGFVLLGLRNSMSVDLGFNPDNLTVMSIDPIRDGYTPAKTQALFGTLPDRIRRVPGVVAAGLAQSEPMALLGGESLVAAKIAMIGDKAAVRSFSTERVGTGFLETLGLPLLKGRSFRESDQRDDARVVVVNTEMATLYWPGTEPVGQLLEMEEKKFEVIGVVGNMRPVVAFEPTRPLAYFPAAPSAFGTPSANGVTLLVRTAGGGAAVAGIRREFASIDPNLVLFNVDSMREHSGRILYMMDVAIAMYGGLGLYALVLSVTGLFGVTSYAVARRNHEIGIRTALGAKKRDVLGLVLYEGIVIVAIGTVTGLGIAFAAMKALGSFMVGFGTATKTSAFDPLLVAGVPLLLAGFALLACYIPARKALRVDPVVALRME